MPLGIENRYRRPAADDNDRLRARHSHVQEELAGRRCASNASAREVGTGTADDLLLRPDDHQRPIRVARGVGQHGVHVCSGGHLPFDARLEQIGRERDGYGVAHHLPHFDQGGAP